jgi:tRNA pseudouridine55 synthase
MTQQGFLYIDKPKGVTSHDVISFLRKTIAPEAKTSRERLRLAKVGHAGTLDPFATGLLIVGVGKEATKQLGGWLKKDKEYVATLELGKTSTTGDPEGDIFPSTNNHQPSIEEITKVIDLFTGELEQIPSPFSAIKSGGKKAYELARKGEDVVMKPRKVTIHSVEILEYEYPRLVIKAWVSSGTYIRTLAQDIGTELGVGAYLTALRRTAIDNVILSEAIELKSITQDTWDTYLQPLTIND